MKGINVLSLFGGIECGRVALEKRGVKVANYFSSEIDPYAIQITSKNYPEIFHIWGVTNVSYRDNTLFWGTRDQEEARRQMRFLRTELDLLIGGSPCQDLSAAKADGKGLAGEKSGLFFEYVRILEEIKAENPDIQFLLENVASMKKADRDEITRIMGVEPILINSALVSAQNRKRLYWTNIPGITQPEDKEIFLRDIIDEIPIEDPSWKQLDEKYIQTLKENKNCLYETNSSGKMRQGYEMFKEDGKTYGITVGHARNTRILWVFSTYNKALQTEKSTTLWSNPQCATDKTWQIVVWQFRRTSLRVHADQEKVCTLTANMGTGGNNVPVIIREKSNAITATYDNTNQRDYFEKWSRQVVVGMALRNRGEGKAPGYYWRKLTPVECERLQTLPENYTNHVSATRRYKAIGNGWTVDVIAHIFSFANF